MEPAGVFDTFRKAWVDLGQGDRDARRAEGVYLVASGKPTFLNDGQTSQLISATQYVFADNLNVPLLPLVDSYLVHFDGDDRRNIIASIHKAHYATLPGKRYGRTEDPLELQKMAAIAWDLGKAVTDVAVVEHGSLRTVVFSGAPFPDHELLFSETLICEADGFADDGTQKLAYSPSTHRQTRGGIRSAAVHRECAYNYEPDVWSVAGVSNDPKTGPALLRAYPNGHKYPGSQPPESQFSFLRPKRGNYGAPSAFDVAFAHYRSQGMPLLKAAGHALVDSSRSIE